MHHDPIQTGEALRRKVDAELDAIESDPAFQRSPVMRRLLRFLVMESLAGRGEKLKSYAIAVEALGRESSFDPQTDSYPRVQVARLRKLLDAHYAHSAPSVVCKFACRAADMPSNFSAKVMRRLPTHQKRSGRKRGLCGMPRSAQG